MNRMRTILTFAACLLASAVAISQEWESETERLLANNQESVLAGLRTTRPESDYGNQDAEVGPWPECVGQSAAWCRDYIASWVGYSTYVKGEQRKGAVKLIRPYEYQVSRVWIHVDDSGAVLAPPERG